MRIRSATPEDAAAIAAIYALYVRDTAITFEIEPPDTTEMRHRIVRLLPTHPWLVAEDGRRLAGYVYAGRHHERAAYQWSVEVTAYLHADYHRQGLGRRLYTALIDILKHQGFHSLYAGITLPNVASLALHRAMGMAEIGTYREAGWKFGAWHDVMWMGMSFTPGHPPDAPPLPFSALETSTVAAVCDRA